MKEAWRDAILSAPLLRLLRGEERHETVATNKNSHPRRVHSLMSKDQYD